jgi:YfiH family protein
VIDGHVAPSPETLQIGPADIRWTDSRHGSFASELPDAGSFLRVSQVHGAGVVVADRSTPMFPEGDALVTVEPGFPIAVATADCAPIALVSEEGVVAAVHAGWRGLEAGVVRATVAQLRSMGATTIKGALGPCIHVECYEFDDPDRLDEFSRRWGSAATGSTSSDKPAFDLPAAVAAELRSASVDLVHTDPRCTACSGDLYSYRATKTADRQLMVVNLVGRDVDVDND